MKKAAVFICVILIICVLGGVLARKTVSMGHAEEKRYYNECRSLAGGLPEEE